MISSKCYWTFLFLFLSLVLYANCTQIPKGNVQPPPNLPPYHSQDQSANTYNDRRFREPFDTNRPPGFFPPFEASPNDGVLTRLKNGIVTARAILSSPPPASPRGTATTSYQSYQSTPSQPISQPWMSNSQQQSAPWQVSNAGVGAKTVSRLKNLLVGPLQDLFQSRADSQPPNSQPNLPPHAQEAAQYYSHTQPKYNHPAYQQPGYQQPGRDTAQQQWVQSQQGQQHTQGYSWNSALAPSYPADHNHHHQQQQQQKYAQFPQYSQQQQVQQQAELEENTSHGSKRFYSNPSDADIGGAVNAIADEAISRDPSLSTQTPSTETLRDEASYSQRPQEDTRINTASATSATSPPAMPFEQQGERWNPPSVADPFLPPEPMVFASGDSVVMILKPQDFFRKKAAFAAAGPRALNVFSDFEHVLTRSHVPGSTGERTVGSAEVLEVSGAIAPEATRQLADLARELEESEMEYSDFESFATKCREVIVQNGHLHISSIAPLVSEFVSRMGLRSGYRETLGTLAAAQVPTYIFSSGYGDIVAQALSPTQALPSNMRIISNFFRLAPDGTVRGFSTPVVHERNKNASTAAVHMDMALPHRANALILGSHEDDVHLADDGCGTLHTLTVGFLELAEDLPQRLPSFLNTFDAVVVGDGSLHFTRSLIEEITSSGRTHGSGRLNAGQQQLQSQRRSNTPSSSFTSRFPRLY